MPIRDIDHFPEHLSVFPSKDDKGTVMVSFTCFPAEGSKKDDSPDVHRVHLDTSEIETLIMKLELFLLGVGVSEPDRCLTCGSTQGQAKNTSANKAD